jgi:hypothetical protein
MPTADRRARRRADDQTDYEDPIDRYRPPDEMAKAKKKAPVNGTANSAYTFGLISLVPCLGAVFGPLAVVLGLMGLSFARRTPDAGGRGRARSGIWFGCLGCFITYGLPAIFVLLAYLARIR